MTEEFHDELLNNIYKEFLQSVGGNQEILLNIWDRLGGQQINLPESLYDRTLVKEYLTDQLAVKSEEQVMAEARKFNVSRRIVRELIRDAKK